jgi:hypothetical protein
MDPTGGGRIGSDNEACREAIAALADQVISGVIERGYVLAATNSDYVIRCQIEQNKRAVNELLSRLNRSRPDDADDSADAASSSGR